MQQVNKTEKAHRTVTVAIDNTLQLAKVIKCKKKLIEKHEKYEITSESTRDLKSTVLSGNRYAIHKQLC